MIIFFSTLFLICMAVFPLHAAHLPDSIFANAVACSSGRDHTVEKSKEFKKKLNAEFMKKAKISDLVSYIYYPYYGDSGHAELEVEGACTTYKSMACERIVGHTCSFDSDMREKRVRRRDSWYLVHKFPFYRYVISVTPEQLKNLSEQVGQRRRCTPICSLDALTELARGAHYAVPLVARLSPFISALYLSMVKHLGSERIKKIEFYAGGEEDRNLIIKGILKECATIALVFCIIGFCSPL